MRLQILLILFLTVCLHGMAQHIAGVVNSSDGPVPGATVQLDKTTGRVTDAQGQFHFTHITPGTYDLVVRSIGYNTLTRRVILEENDSLDFIFELEENSLGLREVVVTGTMSPVHIKNSPVKVEVISSDHINTFLPSAATGIMESISLINGVQEVVACGVCFTNSISINGLPGPYTAVLLDGTPMYGNLASVYGLNGIPASMIDRIEVIKGPNSTLYGSEAVAGVINVITKDPEDQPRIAMDVMGTSHMEAFSNFSFTGKIGRSQGQTGLNHAFVNIFEDENGDGFSDIVNVDRLSLFSKWNIFRPSGRAWTLAGKLYYEDRRNGVSEYLEDRAYKELRGSDSIYGESIYTKRAELFGSYEFAGITDLRMDYSLSHHDQDSYYGKDGYQAMQQIAFANLLWSPVVGNHQLISGITLRYQYYDDNTVATLGADRQFIPGLFVQDEWTVNKKLSFLGGTRIDHYDLHGIIMSPRASVKYQPGDYTTLRANFGTGFRLVNLFTEDHAFVTGQREVVIVDELDPERSINGTLNLNHIYMAGESQGTLDLDVFYTYFRNKILPDYSVPEKIIYDNASGHAITRGISLTASHEMAFPLSFSIGMTFLKATETSAEEDGNQKTRDIEFAPEYSGTFTLNYLWRKAGLQFALSSQVTGPMQLPAVYDLDASGEPFPDPRPLSSEPFAIHSIQVTRKMGSGFTLYGGIQNIFGFIQSYSPLTGFNDPTVPSGFSEYFDTAYSFAPIHGREFYLGLKWELAR